MCIDFLPPTREKPRYRRGADCPAKPLAKSIRGADHRFNSRECIDHVIVLNERHLNRILGSYFAYYHKWRTHLSLDGDTPESRPIQAPEFGEVIEFPDVGGLQRHYERRALTKALRGCERGLVHHRPVISLDGAPIALRQIDYHFHRNTGLALPSRIQAVKPWISPVAWSHFNLIKE